MIIKVNSRNQITLPKTMRGQLNIKPGDKLLLDIQDGMLILIPQLESHSNHLHGLHSEIWKGVDTENYIKGEREAW